MAERIVRLSEASYELARQAVEAGQCDSIEEAVERALQVMTVADLEFAEMVSHWSPEDWAEVRRLVDEGMEDVAAGRVIEAGPDYWRARRDAIERRAAASTSRHAV